MSRAPEPGRGRPWDFGYDPSSNGDPAWSTEAQDVVVATAAAVDVATLRDALSDLATPLTVEVLIARAPLFWARIEFDRPVGLGAAARHLERAAIPLRYVASARAPSMAVPLALDLRSAAPARPTDWASRPRRPVGDGPAFEGQWFLRDDGGVHIDRDVCGTGAGMRLAVIDDDGADLEHLEIDRLVCVGVPRAPEFSGHGALMAAWATGARRPNGVRFVGVAPDASVRIYCTPKPEVDTVSLALAIVRAVFDGADAIVCATYVEGTNTPMLDDALDVAAGLGRAGRGAPVVMPTGRETSSPGNSIHASLSLGLGEPASDPRVHCVAPGGRRGGWFLWQSLRGKLRPFANRGPAVRWLAPGDDLSYPFSSRDRLFHAESSGASAIAVGVVLLVLGCNRGLSLGALHAVLKSTLDAPSSDLPPGTRVMDPADLLPAASDRDAHNARSGYGRLNATRACASVSDPVGLELTAMGEDELAVLWTRRNERPYSPRLARWSARALLTRPELRHAVRAVLRHARLVGSAPERARSHTPGALARQLALVTRELYRLEAPALVRRELHAILERLRDAAVDDAQVFERRATALFHAVISATAVSPLRSAADSPAFSRADIQS